MSGFRRHFPFQPIFSCETPPAAPARASGVWAASASPPATRQTHIPTPPPHAARPKPHCQAAARKSKPPLPPRKPPRPTETARNGNAAASSFCTPASSGLPTRPGSKTQTHRTQTKQYRPNRHAGRHRHQQPCPSERKRKGIMHRQRKRQRQKHQPRKQSRIRIFLVHKHRRPPLPKQTALYRALPCRPPEKLHKQPFIYIITKKRRCSSVGRAAHS